MLAQLADRRTAELLWRKIGPGVEFHAIDLSLGQQGRAFLNGSRNAANEIPSFRAGKGRVLRVTDGKLLSKRPV